jgi:hypothetical protein
MVDEDQIREQEEIEKVRKSRRDLEDAVTALPKIQDEIKQIRDDLCEGPNCLKAKVEEKFTDIDDKIKKIEEKQSDLICDKCHYVGVPSMASYCPNCGAAIYSWNNDEGVPIPGWKHWTERNK